jgi:hypothetical protein
MINTNSSIGQALMSIGSQLPEIKRQRRLDSYKMRRDDEEEKRRQLQDEVTRKALADSARQTELAESARSAYGEFEGNEKLLDQSQGIAGKDELDGNTYMGPLRPEVMDSLAKMSTKNRYERMRESGLPRMAGYDTGVAQAVKVEQDAQNREDSIAAKAAERQAAIEAARLKAEEDRKFRDQAREDQQNFLKGMQTDRLSEKRESAEEKAAESKAAAQEMKNTIIGTVDELLNHQGFATGFNAGRISQMIPGTKGKEFAKKVDNLKSRLTLEERGKLKGQGQISDKESQMLENAVTMLDMNLGKDDFIKELQRIRTALVGGASAQPAADPLGIR